MVCGNKICCYLWWLINYLQNKKREVLQSKKDELQRVHTIFDEAKPNQNVPKRFRLLYKHATTFMKATRSSIQIQCDVEVFGGDMTIFPLHVNLMSLFEFEMIGQAVISAYMAYLHTVISENDELAKTFAFVVPRATFHLNDEFELTWLIGQERIMVITIYSCCIMLSALKTFYVEMGWLSKVPKVKNLIGSPKQLGGHECSYVVIRYMKEIIEDSDLPFTTKWMNKARKCYTRKRLNEVRFEALNYIQEQM